jgi:peptide/nickel transport system permease protein
MITVLGFQVGTMLGGALFVETIFSIPGLGQALVAAVNARDYALVQSLALVVALVFISAVLVADIVNLLLDPRLRKGRLA